MTTQRGAREAYYDASARASEVARQLAFAGIALVWVFSGASDAKGLLQMPSALQLAGVGLAASLASDLLQYALATVLWAWWHRSSEKQQLESTNRIDDDLEIVTPPWINYPALVFFYAKLGTLVVAYGIIVWHLSFNVRT